MVRLLNRAAVLLIDQQEVAARIGDFSIYRVAHVAVVLTRPFAATDLNEYERKAQASYLEALQSFCDGRGLYYGENYDLTMSAQAQARASPDHMFPNTAAHAAHRDEFFWNGAMSQPLINGGVCCCCLPNTHTARRNNSSDTICGLLAVDSATTM